MSDGLESSPFFDPMSAQVVIQKLGEHLDAVVSVRIAGIMVDVYRVTYEPDRDKIVLHLHPDDLDDALQRLSRRSPNVDQAAERASGRKLEL